MDSFTQDGDRRSQRNEAHRYDSLLRSSTPTFRMPTSDSRGQHLQMAGVFGELLDCLPPGFLKRSPAEIEAFRRLSREAQLDENQKRLEPHYTLSLSNIYFVILDYQYVFIVLGLTLDDIKPSVGCSDMRFPGHLPFSGRAAGIGRIAEVLGFTPRPAHVPASLASSQF
ncbi:hypothetical protein C8J56DRAFT_1163904 [Mycena floridula]|nr:hypothetical protein C8J56DRAFT_1163904 [Mycena floridula]